MPVSSSRLSYSDCETLFEKALDDTKGARYSVGDGNFGTNQYFRMRMHQFRALDRKDNLTLHEPDAPLYGRSIYDPLVVQLKKDPNDRWWVYVSHTEINEAEILLLSADDPVEAEFTEVVPSLAPRPPLLQLIGPSIKRRV